MNIINEMSGDWPSQNATNIVTIRNTVNKLTCSGV